MYDFMKLLLQKLPDYIILYIGTNDALDNTSREMLDKILKLKTYIHQLNDTTIEKHHYLFHIKLRNL